MFTVQIGQMKTSRCRFRFERCGRDFGFFKRLRDFAKTFSFNLDVMNLANSHVGLWAQTREVRAQGKNI